MTLKKYARYSLMLALIVPIVGLVIVLTISSLISIFTVGIDSGIGILIYAGVFFPVSIGFAYFTAFLPAFLTGLTTYISIGKIEKLKFCVLSASIGTIFQLIYAYFFISYANSFFSSFFVIASISFVAVFVVSYKLFEKHKY